MILNIWESMFLYCIKYSLYLCNKITRIAADIILK